MRSIVIALAVTAFTSLAATAFSPAGAALQDSGEQGRLLFKQDVSMYAAERGPLDGAPGASSVGFKVSDGVQGGALIVGLDQPVLGVFVGLNAPKKYVDAPYQDLHVTFTLADGTTRIAKPAAGGGTAILFQSPNDVPMTSLREVSLYVDKGAKWAK